MNTIISGYFIISIAILQCQVRIIFAEEHSLGEETVKEDFSHDSYPEAKTTSEEFILSWSSTLHFSLSPQKTEIYPSTEDISVNTVYFTDMYTPHLPISNSPLLFSSNVLPSISIQSLSSEISSQLALFSSLTGSNEVPSSYLLNSYYPVSYSSYLLDDSSYLFEDSFLSGSYPLKNLLLYPINETELNLSSILNPDTKINSKSSLNDTTHYHSKAESLILTRSPELKSFIQVSHSKDILSSNLIPVIFPSDSPSSTIIKATSVFNEIFYSTTASNFEIYTKYTDEVLSSNSDTQFHKHNIKNNSEIEISKRFDSFDNENLTTETGTIKEEYATLSDEMSTGRSDEILLELESRINSAKNQNKSKEILDNANLLKNKTSRNEETQLGNIINGIIHLLAGNVQLSRPSPNPFSTHPKIQNRPIAFHSTRINNRGPLSSSTFSRTVVVFSQPKNQGILPTRPHRPIQFIPSTTNAPHLPRPPHKHIHAPKLQSTKVNDRYTSNIPVVPFYHSGASTQLASNVRPPFISEIFSHGNDPTITNAQIPKYSEKIDSNLNKLKPQHTKTNDEKTYPHFIFSDGSGSSIIIQVPTISSQLQPSKVASINSRQSHTKFATKTYEVLLDSSNENRITLQEKQSSKHLSEIKEMQKNVTRDKIGSTQFSSLTGTSLLPSTVVPFGPITDWVPVFERPGMKFKPGPSYSNKTLDENDVSIITKPIIFDITVSNSINKMQPSKFQPFQDKTLLQSSHDNSKSNSMTEESIMTTKSIFHTDSSLLSSSVTSLENNSAILLTTIPTYEAKATPALSSQPSAYEKSTNSEKFTTPIKSLDITETSSDEGYSSIDQPSHRSEGSNISKEYPQRVQSTKRQQIHVSISTVKSIISSTFPYSSSVVPNPQETNLGRPIVIPVDIEEVRPYAGAINPVNHDNLQPKFHPGNIPVPPFHATRATNDDFRGPTALSTIPFKTSKTPIIRSPPRLRPNTIRIDTCIVGDDSTCDVKVNETCKTEHGISSCHCRPGYARSYTRGPCIPIVAIRLSLKLDRFGNRKISFSPKYLDKNSEDYRVLEFEAKQALSSLFGKSAFSRTFLGMNVNMFHSIGGKLFANCTIYLEEKESTRAQSVRIRLRQEIGDAIRKKNQNIGDSRLYVEGPLSPITTIEDVNECSDFNLNDCSSDGACYNVFGTFLCKCKAGYVDPFIHDERRSGRRCLACSSEYCNYHGQCYVEREQKLCKCQGNYIGSRCEIDGEVLGVALGASLAAIIIILLTFACLCIWNRKWKRQQQKAEVLSARSYNSTQTFTYLSNMMNANANAYQLTMEDRMRWAHISDVVKSASPPNSEQPYSTPCPPIEQPSFPALRFQQHSNDEEATWYDYRTRPRSRIMPLPVKSSSASYYEMEPPSRSAYATTSYSSKRYHNPNSMARY